MAIEQYSPMQIYPQSPWGVSIGFTAFTLATLTMNLNSWVGLDKSRSMAMNNEILPTDPKCVHSKYDYIVVGSGAAGMVVATRLANASSEIRVLLLEAGGEPHICNNIPMLDFQLMNQPANTWIYPAVPQVNSSQNCYGRRPITTRGKMFGGSTSSNFMLYCRGNKEDFNRWAKDVNDEHWNYSNVLPYFKKSEDYNGAYADSLDALKYHGKGGLLNIATHEYMPGADQFLSAAAEKGYKIGDYNGEDQEVFSKADVTTQNGWRESTYRAFYRDTGKPKNLCIKSYAHVTKVLFDMTSKTGIPRAVGVNYIRQFETRTILATKEVILSAGAIESPKILMLSGIGPSEHLKEMNIPVVKDLPVGQDFQDHTYTIVGPFLKSPSLSIYTSMTAGNLANFLFRGKGPLAAPAAFAGNGFLTSPQAEPRYPDLQSIQFSIGLSTGLPHILNKALGLDNERLNEWFQPYNREETDARLVIILLGRPKSTGTLTLTSRNPMDEPTLDPRYLSEPSDVEALLYGYKKILDLYENTTALNTPLFPKPLPACEHIQFKTDDYFRCVIRQISGSFYHHVGTCAMGKVVDSKLRVMGINGLRVVDASVMPRTPNGNTMAATIMIAERSADLLIDDLKKFIRQRRTYMG